MAFNLISNHLFVICRFSFILTKLEEKGREAGVCGGGKVEREGEGN